MTLDGELLRRYAKNHDQSAFAELLRRHLDGVFSAALRRVGGDTHLAEDVAQHVFVQLARQAARVADHPVLTAWLYLTTRNQAVMVVRAEQRRKIRETEAQLMNQILSDQSPEGHWEQVAPLLDWAIDRLNDRDRSAVLLRFIARKPFDEIGGELNLSGDAARMRVERALEKLRAVLARRGVRSTAALLGADLTSHAVVAAPLPLATGIATAAAASGAAVLGPAAFLFQLMTTSKILVGAAAATLILAGFGTAAHELQAHQETERLRVTLTTRQQLARAHLQETKERIQSLNTQAALKEKKAEDDRAARAALEMKQKEAAATWDPEEEGRAFLARHPEVKQALFNWKRGQNAYQWGALYRTLKLTPQQTHEFEAVMNAKGWFGRDLDAARNNYVKMPTGEAIPDQEATQRLKAVLGESGYAKMAEISQQQFARGLVTQTAGSLALSDNALSPAQANQLVTIFSRNRVPGKVEGFPAFKWNDIVTQAAKILSPPQLLALGEMQAQDEYQRAYSAAATRMRPADGKEIVSTNKPLNK